MLFMLVAFPDRWKIHALLVEVFRDCLESTYCATTEIVTMPQIDVFTFEFLVLRNLIPVLAETLREAVDSF